MMTDKIKAFLIAHYRIIILALLIGLISSVPQYIDKNTRGDDFKGIHIGVVKDTGFYMARVKDVIDGHPYLTNPYIYEHKDGAPMQFWLPEFILAQPIKWFGLSIATGFILWTFVLTTIIALLTYAILLTITRSKYWGLLGVTLLSLGLFGIKFLRIPPHGFTFVFWLTTLLCLLLFIKNNKTRYILASAISFGLLFSIYPYYWTFYVVVFAVFIALGILIYRREIPFKKYALIFGGGLVIGIPYFISMWQSSNLPGYSESLARLGLIHTHFPSGIDSVIVASITAVIFIIMYMRKVVTINHQSVFLFSGVLSAAIVINQHLITGKNVEFSSHYMLGNMYWCAFVLIYLLAQWVSTQSDKIRRVIVVVCTLIVVPMGLYGATKVVNQQVVYRQAEDYVQNYAPIFDWLNENASPDEVVFANDDLSGYIPIYTAQNVYFSGLAILSFMTDDEAYRRFITNRYFDKFDTDYVRYSHRQIFGGYYVNEYGHNMSKNKLRKLLGMDQVKYEMVPDVAVQKIMDKASVIQKDDFEIALKTYRVDYFIWDKLKDPHWKVEEVDFLERVYEYKGIIVYRVL